MLEEISVRESSPAMFAGDGFEVGDTIWMAEIRIDGQLYAAQGLTANHARQNLERYIADSGPPNVFRAR